MTVLEFTNKIDGTINDFESGVIDNREFRIIIMDTLIEVAKPKLEGFAEESDTLEYQLIFKHFTAASEKDGGFFYQPTYILIRLNHLTGQRLSLSNENVGRALVRMGINRTAFRKPYEKITAYGYWLKERPLSEIV